MYKLQRGSWLLATLLALAPFFFLASRTADAASVGTVGLSASTYTVAQSAGSLTVTVNRTGGSSGAVSADYATNNGTAVAGTNYTQTQGTLKWADGDAAAKTFTIKIATSPTFTGTKSFAFNLFNPTGGVAIGAMAATANITGAGASSSTTPGSVGLSATTYSVAQSAGSLTVTVNRTGGSSGAVSADYATNNGTAVAGTDYTQTQGTLKWADGDAAAKTFSIKIATSPAFSGTKSFAFNLFNPTGSVSIGTMAATATITGSSSSATTPGSLALSASTYTVSQSAGSLTVTVNRASGTSGTVGVNYATANGTAVAGTDYTAASGSLSWAAGDAAAKTFKVSVSNASPYSGSKAFSIALSSATGGASMGSPTSATATIAGSGAVGSLALSAASYAVAQSAGSLTVTVNRSGGSGGSASIKYATANGTAASGADYTATSGTLNWASGDAAAKTFTVPISNATPFSGSKTFTINLSSATGSTAGSPTSATATINGSSGTASAQIVIDASSNVAPISSRQLGTNLATWGTDVTDTRTLADVQSINAKLVRWPGGSSADDYHWQNHSQCGVSNYNTTPWTYTSSGAGNAYRQSNTFDNFMNDVIAAGHIEAAITVPYGTNAACTGGGDPSEAASWVSYNKSKGYNAHYWTVGNEEFGGWEDDLHSPQHSGSTYAAAMSGSNGYYSLMKAADSTAQIGVVVEGAGWGYWDGWDAAVLPNAPFDYVEIHWYAQQPGSESDSYLLTQAPQAFTSTINTVRSELTQAGKSASTPIMVGEFNSVAYNPGKQTTSIVNALFLGMTFGEMLNDNVPINTMWFGAGGTQGCGANNSSSLYGWQTYGGYDAVASNTQYAWNGCNNGPTVPESTVFPNGRAAYLVGQFATPGSHVLKATVNSSLSNIRAYAATQGSGYAMMLFNLSSSASQSVTVGLSNASASSFSASSITYGKQQYDDSQNNVWTGPVSQTIGTVGSTLTVTLPAYSMTVVKLQ